MLWRQMANPEGWRPAPLGNKVLAVSLAVIAGARRGTTPGWKSLIYPATHSTSGLAKVAPIHSPIYTARMTIGYGLCLIHIERQTSRGHLRRKRDGSEDRRREHQTCDCPYFHVSLSLLTGARAEIIRCPDPTYHGWRDHTNLWLPDRARRHHRSLTTSYPRRRRWSYGVGRQGVMEDLWISALREDEAESPGGLIAQVHFGFDRQLNRKVGGLCPAESPHCLRKRPRAVKVRLT
jgi:hypothetical protein